MSSGGSEVSGARQPSAPSPGMAEVLTLRAFYPNFFTDRQIAYVCLRLIEHLEEDGKVAATVMGLSSDETVGRYRHRSRSTGRAIYSDAIPRGIPWSVARRLLGSEAILRLAEASYLRQLRTGEVAYLWPGASLALHRRIKARGQVIVTERINTLRSNSKTILDREYAELGIPADHGITDNSAHIELACMQSTDYIFSPSPAVAASLTRAGIPPERIINTSYGLRSSEILQRTAEAPPERPMTVLFVGRICVRKGIHLLLKAWERAAIDGKLRIVGDVAPEIADLFSKYLRTHDSVEHFGYVADLRPCFEEADVFILPSLEEGSPLVTYLALGASLPLIVSPMGAGGVVTDLEQGFVVDPKDEERLAAAIQRLAGDAALRNAMGRAAGRTAREYTWDKVGARRRRQLLEKLGR